MGHIYLHLLLPILTLLSFSLFPYFFFHVLCILNTPPIAEEFKTEIMGLAGILGHIGRLSFLFVLAIYFYILEIIKVLSPPKKKDVRNEIVLITGAGHGIGREIALEFGRLGARVVIWDINKVLANQKVMYRSVSFVLISLAIKIGIFDLFN